MTAEISIQSILLHIDVVHNRVRLLYLTRRDVQELCDFLPAAKSRNMDANIPDYQKAEFNRFLEDHQMKESLRFAIWFP